MTDHLGAARARTTLMLLGGIVVCAVAVLALRGIASLAPAYEEQAPKTPTLGEIELITGLYFPDGSRLVGAASVAGRRRLKVWARVHFPRGSTEQFARSFPRPHRASYEIRNVKADPPQPWWTPDQTRDIVSVVWTTTGRTRVRALVGFEDEKTSVVFIYATQ